MAVYNYTIYGQNTIFRYSKIEVMEKITGRIDEIKTLQGALRSKHAELIAIYGRRRVGKTFLVHNYYQKQLAFELTGMYSGTLKEQLQQFSKSFEKATKSPLSVKAPENWIKAFNALEIYLDTKNKKEKWVIFLDEFPWLDGRKSGFLSAFEHFWNTWASRQPNAIVIICGSAASWMIKNIVNNKGGLHNRITQKIRLLPFTLTETEQFLKSQKIKLDRYQILQIYMAFGGIPQYLKNIQRGKSASQVIEKTCFSKDGLLTGEFNNLYSSLFEIADNHLKVVRALAKTTKGLTRQEIIDTCKLSSGGRTTEMLEELEESGFIKSMPSFEKNSNDGIFRLIDEYSIFYLKFMDKTNAEGKDIWGKISSGLSYKIWCGMAFEAVCLKHVDLIKKGLEITVKTQESTWRHLPKKGEKDTGAQIDLVIDRDDKSINLCEMKFYDKEFQIDKAYSKIIEQKINVFAGQTKTKKAIFLTMVSTYGVKENIYSSMIQNSLTMDILFE